MAVSIAYISVSVNPQFNQRRLHYRTRKVFLKIVPCNPVQSFFVHVSDSQVLEDVRRVVGDSNYWPKQPKELCSRIFTTCYMGSENSTEDTRRRAKDLASEVGR